MTNTTISKDDIERVRINARIQELTKQREEYVTQANQQIAMFTGAIQALEELLAPPTEEPTDTETSTPVSAA